MFSSNVTVAKAEFSWAYYDDPRFEVNHYVTLFDVVVEINFFMAQILLHPA